ncbi:MAG: PTS sugar transporter subunit IIA [Clostridiales Family XIII bacterium]|nr:PTS sugar transporter subunit IIA [Clostridiales Family XIII bacterium]
MRKIVIATHGHFAEGILSSVHMILGQTSGVETMNAFVDEGFDISAAVRSCVDSAGDDDELIVLTDMFGGSVNNEFMKYLGKPKYHLIAGVNLPLLLELYASNDMDAGEMIEHALNAASGSIQYCNAAFARFKADDNANENDDGI